MESWFRGNSPELWNPGFVEIVRNYGILVCGNGPDHGILACGEWMYSDLDVLPDIPDLSVLTT